MLLMLVYAIIGTGCLFFLHLAYVGHAGCLQQVTHHHICGDNITSQDYMGNTSTSFTPSLVSTSDGTGTALPVLVIEDPQQGPDIPQQQRQLGILGDDLSIDKVVVAAQPTTDMSNITVPLGNNRTSDPAAKTVHSCTGVPAKDDIVLIFFDRDVEQRENARTAVIKSIQHHRNMTANGTAMVSPPVNPNSAVFNRSFAHYEWSRSLSVLALPKELRQNHSFNIIELVRRFFVVLTSVDQKFTLQYNTVQNVEFLPLIFRCCFHKLCRPLRLFMYVCMLLFCRHSLQRLVGEWTCWVFRSGRGKTR